MPLQPDSIVEELKRAHLKCSVWLNALKAILPSLTIEVYGWKVRGDYNRVPVQLSGNQMPPFIANSSETDLK